MESRWSWRCLIINISFILAFGLKSSENYELPWDTLLFSFDNFDEVLLCNSPILPWWTDYSFYVGLRSVFLGEVTRRDPFELFDIYDYCCLSFDSFELRGSLGESCRGLLNWLVILLWLLFESVDILDFLSICGIKFTCPFFYWFPFYRGDDGNSYTFSFSSSSSSDSGSSSSFIFVLISFTTDSLAYFCWDVWPPLLF